MNFFCGSHAIFRVKRHFCLRFNGKVCLKWFFYFNRFLFYFFYFIIYFFYFNRIAPLTAHLQPQVQIVDVDKDAQFQCIVSGHPVYETNWFHDGKPIIRDNRIEVSLSLICAKLFVTTSAHLCSHKWYITPELSGHYVMKFQDYEAFDHLKEKHFSICH